MKDMDVAVERLNKAMGKKERILDVYKRQILNMLPKLEPIAEPVSTIGASAPTEPPKPMVMELAMIDDQVLCLLMRPCLRDMA